MKKLIFVVGLHFLVKAGIDTFRVVEHFSSYTFKTAYETGFATGQVMVAMLFLVVGVLLIRHSWPGGLSVSRQAPAA